MGWTTSYQAGSSSSESPENSDEDSEEDLAANSRGRRYSNSRSRMGHAKRPSSSSSVLRPVLHRNSSGDSSTGGRSVEHAPFTRSRSPCVTLSGSIGRNSRPTSPTVTRGSRPKLSSVMPTRALFPTLLELRIPLVRFQWLLSIDARRAGECIILLASYLYAATNLSQEPEAPTRLPTSTYNFWTVQELYLLGVVSSLYIIWTHSIIVRKPRIVTETSSTPTHSPPPSTFRQPETRDLRRNPTPLPKKTDFGFIWMSVPKNYRNSSDDGITTGLFLCPFIASALLFAAVGQFNKDPTQVLSPSWLIEPPGRLSNPKGDYTALEALILSRYNLVDLGTLCSFILLFHVCASWWLESWYRSPSATFTDGERRSVPRSEGRRSWLFILFTLSVCLSTLGTKAIFKLANIGIWQHLNFLETAVSSLFYQFTLYIAIRLAHRGFTLGELGVVCFGGTALFMEFLNITIARIWPVTTPFVKTYRAPTPLLLFQTALIAGSFLDGFLLAPFLILSRHVARRPLRRLRFPEEKLRQRRFLALGFYIGSVFVIVGLIGMWTRWCLGSRDPWLWVIFWLLEGRRKWTRPVLLAYWAAVGSLSVAAWSRQLARSRRYRAWNPAGENLIVPWAFDSSQDVPMTTGTLSSSSGSTPPSTSNISSAAALGLTLPTLPNLPNLSTGSNVATDLLDAADKHVPTLRLNARRKFFHALAVAMFTPGVIIDPAFTHLSFSAAFALFTFAEYMRYFAIYPFGAVIHLFMNEFLDSKDSGTAILSHFYLLTGCAGSLWLDSSSALLQLTGILVLGVGDAMASIVGKRVGNHRWSFSTPKTIEGSLAFTVSIVACALFFRLCGIVEPFSTLRYTAVISAASVLEALSDQNDNLTLPLYTWGMLVLAGV